MMKKFFSAVLVLPLVLFAVSCSESNDEGGGNGPVQLAPGTSPVQQVYADEQQGPAPIKFTAAGPWAATVVAVATKAVAVGGSQVDWLTLSAYRGGAGEVSLTMGLQPNLTGQDRKAEIRIACKGTIITITVVQKGTTESGETPEPANYALVESIEVDYFAGCKDKYNRNADHYVFRYDDKNRVAEYEITEYDCYNDDKTLKPHYKYTTRIDYTLQDEIRMTETTTSYNSSDYLDTETYRVELDDYGRAIRFKEDGNGSDADSPITFSYNDEGRLTRISYSSSEYEDMTYQNGVLTKVFHYDEDGTDEEFIFPDDAFSDHTNDRLNIDPNWLVFTDPVDPEHMLTMLRLAGKSCDRLTLWRPSDDDEDWNWELIDRWEEPNVTVHKVHDYYEHETTGRLQYTFNDDGTIATIVQPVTCIQMRREYDIVSGSELYDPENPEAGYKATQENKKTSEVGRSTDRHEWTFAYRK